MNPDDFSRKFPLAFHMAEPGSWPNIRRLGLLSTRALLDLFEITGEQRTDIEGRRRPASVVLEHPTHGRVVLRDQIPLNERKLAGCLSDGTTVTEWLQLLNGYVFFWVQPKRLLDLREAHAYRGKRQLVITVSTADLVRNHLRRAFLTDRNTGATRPMAHPRGRHTFVPLSDSDPQRRVVELAIEGSVPDIEHYAVRVEEVGGGKPDEVVLER